jgi:hypothetical protein
MSHRYDSWAASQSDEIEGCEMGLFVSNKGGGGVSDRRLIFFSWNIWLGLKDFDIWAYEISRFLDL